MEVKLTPRCTGLCWHCTPEGMRHLRSDLEVREAIADTLMDLRMDGPSRSSRTTTYQEAMRHYADVILDALLGPR